MKFRSEYTAEEAGVKLNPAKGVLLVGSCFADNISQRMQSCGWDAQNPFGVLFNPLSIAQAINLSLQSDADAADEIRKSIFESPEAFHSWLFSSKKSGSSMAIAQMNISDALTTFRDTLPQCEALFVTFGTAWCYFLAENPEYVVANCHKQPQQIFTRRRISIEEITTSWQPLLEVLHAKNPQMRVIFTVSPVRHLKDGFAGNARSKATLLLAVEQLCEDNEFCQYFPAYEIVNDDLRDYRFYADDLVHPSTQAVEYIWEKFLDTYVDTHNRELLRIGEKNIRRSNHKPIIK
ncbi:MAG: GSCFA domain-containing protein [Bacteroidales bacterium]|nr:GSCFA domain-containing protein [Bacteroidales bacterium]